MRQWLYTILTDGVTIDSVQYSCTGMQLLLHIDPSNITQSVLSCRAGS